MHTKFRTHQEMENIYGRRHESGLSDLPYLLKYSHANTTQLLIYNGTRHSFDPEESEYKVVLQNWDEFVQNKNTKKIVMCEGQVRTHVKDKTQDEAVLSDGDSGLACLLAYRAGYELISPEPDRREEIASLVKKFGSNKTFVYYFGRQMHQWAHGDFMNTPDWKSYATQWLERNRSLPFNIKDLDLELALNIFKEVTGTAFSWSSPRLLYKISNPFDNPVSAESSELRNQNIYQEIENYWNNGYSIFVVFGSGHAIVQEPALDALPGAVKQLVN